MVYCGASPHLVVDGGCLLLPRKLWRLLAGLPFFAFIISYCYTAPRLIYFTDFHFDGLGIIFLFVATLGASLFGLCYVVSALPAIRPSKCRSSIISPLFRELVSE